jgi:HEAT repeat protein
MSSFARLSGTLAVVVVAAWPRLLIAVSAPIVDDIVGMLSSQDAGEIVNRALPLFYANLRDDRLTPLLRSVWQADRKSYPSLSWDLLTEPEVKLPIGRLWCQWLRYRGETGSDYVQVRTFALPYLSDRSEILRAAAISLIGSCGTIEDLEFLKNEVLHDSDQNVAAAAVFAIYSLLGDKAKPILLELKPATANSFVAGRIDAVLRMINDPSSTQRSRSTP